MALYKKFKARESYITREGLVITNESPSQVKIIIETVEEHESRMTKLKETKNEKASRTDKSS